jgi:membrane protease YdiL (CAAX protease family)
MKRALARLSQLHRQLVSAPVDVRVPTALLTTAVAVTLLHYFARPLQFERWFPQLCDGPWGPLPAWAYRTGLRLVLYVALPLSLARASGLTLEELGVGLAGFRRHAWLYLALFGAVLPVIIAISYTRGFSSAYPLYHEAGNSVEKLAVWWAIYALSFFTIEFFYRGFLLAMLRRSLGLYCVFVMTVPYVMIHFTKPFAESLGAILTGLVLGTLALATRSIWYGFLLHVSVALTMDLLALAHRDLLWSMPLR